MVFQGGGWTLVQVTNGGTCQPGTETQGAVTLGSCTYTPLATVEALAALSSSVHIRSASGTGQPTAYVTSIQPLPITTLQQGFILNYNITPGDNATAEAQWTVVGDPGVTSAIPGQKPINIFDFSCSVSSNPSWPNIYWACGNGTDGFHLVNGWSIWDWSLGGKGNLPMEVYVR